MDTYNLFFTRNTALHARLEYGLGLLICVGLILLNWSEVNVLLGIALFALMDLIGTVPSLIAFHRSPDGQISKVYYVLYNVLHSAVFLGLVILGFVLVSGWQWALLAIPAHLCADRSIFNNYPKPHGVAFDPVPHPVFRRFQAELAAYDPARTDWKAVKQADHDATSPTPTATDRA